MTNEMTKHDEDWYLDRRCKLEETLDSVMRLKKKMGIGEDADVYIALGEAEILLEEKIAGLNDLISLFEKNRQVYNDAGRCE